MYFYCPVSLGPPISSIYISSFLLSQVISLSSSTTYNTPLDDGLLGAVVFVPIQAAVLYSLGGFRFPRDDDVSTGPVPLSVDLRSLASLVAPDALFGQVLSLTFGLLPGLVLLPSFGLTQIASTLARTLHSLGKCTQCLDT